MPGPVITSALVEALRTTFVLDWHGVHGSRHWARVRVNGLLLAKATGARSHVVELFAFIHDACRQHEGHDPDHGPRAADLARQLNGRFFRLDERDLTLLAEACHGHSDGKLEADVTVQTCWDADRLDLGRVGIRPQPDRLCTLAARDRLVIERAYHRSTHEFRRWSRQLARLRKLRQRYT